MTKTKMAAPVVATAPAQQSQDLFAMFQAFMQTQSPAPVSVPVGTEGKGVKSAPQRKPKASAKATQAITIEKVEKNGEMTSFFVYGDQAPAMLAPFFARKPHLDRGFKERANGKKAYWFGGKQYAKIKKALNLA